MNALTNTNSRLDCYSRIYVDFSHTHTLECSQVDSLGISLSYWHS